MSEATYTPGPWVAVELPTVFAIKSNDGNIANIQRGSNPDQKQANASLIAAAPELLAALILAVDALDKLGDMSDSDVSPHAWFSLDCEDVVENSKALIAKVTGGGA